MKYTLSLKAILLSSTFTFFTLVPNSAYAQPLICTSTSSSVKISNTTEFQKVISNAVNHLKTKVVLSVPSRDLDTYSELMQSFFGIAKYDLSLLSSSNKNLLTITMEYKQAYRITQSLKNPSLVSSLTTSDKELIKVAQSILDKIITPDMSDYEKELAIHDYIIHSTSYDYKNLQTNTLPDSAYTAYGILVQKKGVCQGYSEATQLLCNLANVQCEIVYGSSYSDTSSTSIGHAWNIVKLDNKWYMLDTTFDDQLVTTNGTSKEELSYDYFNVTNEILSKDHIWEQSKYPKATNMDYNYYHMTGQTINSYNEFKAFILKEISSGKKEISCYVNDFNSNLYNLDFIFTVYSGEIQYVIPSDTSGVIRIKLS